MCDSNKVLTEHGLRRTQEEPYLFTPLLMAKLSFLKFLNHSDNHRHNICSTTEGNEERQRQIQTATELKK